MNSGLSPFESFHPEASDRSRPLRAVINLSAFKKNIALIKTLVAPADPILVVKADAYGHGLVNIAKVVGENDLAVAVPEELKEIRQAGIKNRVWVLEGPFSVACLKNSNHVVWVIHSVWQIEIIQTALAQGVIDHLDICIKFDTGMHRLGFIEPELATVKRQLDVIPQVNIFSVMTHFAMSETPCQSSVHSQMAKFDDWVFKCGWQGIKQALANSGGLMNYQHAHRDWVRPGIMLYSGESSSEAYAGLQPVMSFESAIISIRHIQAGESVGYGKTWTAKKASRIATVAVGYADGYPRHASNGTPVAIISSTKVSETGCKDVQLASLAGRVSMDMITIDVTDIHEVAVGDIVQLWGDHIPVGKVAELSGTISYELLTSVSKRVPRVYDKY